MIQYNLLATVVALGGALFGMEWLASWRLRTAQRRRREAASGAAPVSSATLIFGDASSRRLSGTHLIARTFLWLCLLAVAGPAALHAQSTKIFVASFGNDANDGSRGSPKRNFQAAQNAVAPGGEIVVLDTAGYGRLIITKSVGVVVPPGVNGFITVTDNSNGILISAGATDRVSLRGLVIEGNGAASSGSGVIAFSVGALVIEDCAVRNFSEGVFFRPANNAQFWIHDTSVRGCSIGLDIETSNGAFGVTAFVDRCRLEDNAQGLFVLPSGTGSVDVTATDCAVTGGNTGVVSNGASSTVRLSNCTIAGNNFGAFTVGGGKLFSRGNNTLERNTNANTFPAIYSAK